MFESTLTLSNVRAPALDYNLYHSFNGHKKKNEHDCWTLERLVKRDQVSFWEVCDVNWREGSTLGRLARGSNTSVTISLDVSAGKSSILEPNEMLSRTAVLHVREIGTHDHQNFPSSPPSC